MDNSLWIIIPAYNEGERVGPVLKEAKKYTKNVVLVDDGSSDDTSEVGKKEKVTVLKHVINLGKGGALKTGCDYAVKNGAKKIIVMDSDGQHNPKKIPNFVKALEGKDIVFGYRTFNKNMPFIYKHGNNFINLVIHALYGMKLKDTQSGYRAFTSNTYKKIRWKANDYSMESEMIANAGKNHLKYEEIPIETIYLDRYKGTTVFDGMKIVFNMIMWRLRK